MDEQDKLNLLKEKIDAADAIVVGGASYVPDEIAGKSIALPGDIGATLKSLRK